MTNGTIIDAARLTSGCSAASERAAAAEERHRLLGIMDLAAIMVRDLDGTIRLWSAGCRRLYGWNASAAIGRSSHDLLQTTFPEPLADIEATLLREGEWSGDLHQRRQDGAEVVVAVRTVLHRDIDGRGLSIMENVTDVTAPRRAEAALRDSEARLRLVQQVGRIAYYDRTLTAPALVSEEFARLYCLPPGQTDVSAENWLERVHPDDRGQLIEQRHRLLARGGTLTTEFRVRRADGLVRSIAMYAEAFLGEDGQPLRVVYVQQDITEIVAAREVLATHQEMLERRVVERTAALAAAEVRFHGIFDSQFQFIGLLAPDGTLLEVNHAALAAAGLTRDQVLGRPFWETGWWAVEDRDRLRQDIIEAAQGIPIRHDVENQGADGHPIWVDFSLKAVRDPATGAVMWIIAEGHDLTEKRALANQVAQVEKVQALGQLAGGIAHDFNNILQTVSGAAALIERHPEDPAKVRRLARATGDAAARGASITQRLLALSRRGEFRAEVIATAELINSIREVLAHALDTTTVVRDIVSSGIPPMAADRGQLETALVNLGANARDAMPDGGTLTLSAEAERVSEYGRHPAGLAPGDYVRLSVADTGVGMDAETLARVTEPFFTTKPTGQGSGLGLTMVKGFVEQSGGALSISSSPEVGTTVELWLPQAMNDFVPAQRDDNARKMTVAAAARILLVDDDDLVRETLAAQLEDVGFSTLVAASGSEALALIEAGEVVDAMVSDLSMPGMNGMVTIQKTRAMRPKLPCFLLTGYVGGRAALSPDGAFTLVHKPVGGRALAARIEAALAAVRQPRARVDS